MRTAKGFTPTRLERWDRLGRGTGHGATYQPWHQVTRDDPPSRGRSHVFNWRYGRLLHLLSDLELVAIAFATMHPGLTDLAEQCRLPYETTLELVTPSVLDGRQQWTDGTQAIAEQLGVPHPRCRGEKRSVPWVMTTDLVLSLSKSAGTYHRVAVSVKDDADLPDRRTLRLLSIEREYWCRQDVAWLLLTPALYDKATAWLLRGGIAWALGCPPVSPAVLAGCIALAGEFQNCSMDIILALLKRELEVDHETAQAAFWQAVWAGGVWLKLSQALRPFAPLQFLTSPEAFWQQNPIVAGRSSWQM